jgi:hypothetical protein
MSGERTKTTTESQQERKRTPEQERLDILDLSLREAGQQDLLRLQGQGADIASALLQGLPLPGAFGEQLFGIDPETIGLEATRVAQRAQPGFQKLGILDSGPAFEETAREVAQSVLFPAEQFNVGALQNALNIALAGQAQIQQPGLQRTSALGQRLAQFGTTTGSQTQSTLGMNPFLKSWQEQLGKTLGGSQLSAEWQF